MFLEIITPEKSILKEEIDEILAPTADGQIGILPHHINIVTTLTAGEVIIKTGDKEKVYAVTGGFMHVNNNSVTVLADYAAHADEISVEDALEAKRRAEEILKNGAEQLSERDFALAEAELRKSILNINVGKKRKRRNF